MPQKSVPTKLKKLRGNPGKRALNRREPAPKLVNPPAPLGVLMAEARVFWVKIAPMLFGLGLLTETDVPAFRILCDHYGLAMRAMKEIKQHGLLVTSDKGALMKNPALQIYRDSSTAFRLMAEQFGLTPSARARVQYAAEEEPDLIDELFARIDGK